jgi:WD40 repeat protein
MEAFMSRNPDHPHQTLRTPHGLSRRGFIRAAGAAAAGTAVFGNPLLNTAYGANRKKIHSSAKRPTCVATVTETSVVTSDDNGHLIRWDVDGEATNPITSATNHGGKKAAFVTYSNPLRRALTAGYDGRVILHDVAHLDQPAPAIFTKHLQGNPKREVWVVAVSPDGKQAVSSTNDGQILLWDTASPDAGPVTQFGDFHDPVSGLAFIPAAQGPATEFLSTHVGGVVHLWKVGKTKDADREYSHDNDQPVNAVAVEKTGKFFISASFDLTLRRWDLVNRDNKQPLKTLTGHKNWVWRVAISPDGDLAASAGEDGYVHVWKLNEGGPDIRPWKSFGRFDDGVMGVTFTRQDRIVFTSGASNVQPPLTVRALTL